VSRCGGGRYKRSVSGHGWVGLLCTGRLSRLFLRMCNRFPAFAQCQAIFSSHVEWMHLYFNGLPDETIHVSGLGGKKFSVL